MSSTTASGSPRDASYVAYLTRENAWLRAQLERVCRQHEELRAVLEELRLEAEVLEARARRAAPPLTNEQARQEASA